MSFLSAHPDAPRDAHGAGPPPTTLDDASDVLASCGPVQSVVAMQAVLEVLADDLIANRAHVEDPGAERAELSALIEAVTQNRGRLSGADAAGTARHALSSVWAWHAGALTWHELMATLVESVQKDLGLLIGDGPNVIELDADDIDLAAAFHSVLAALKPEVGDAMAANATAFLVRWWMQLERRLPFRSALTCPLQE